MGASATQESHTPHGSGVGPFSQFSDAGEDARAGGLAAAARPAEQVGVVDPAVAQRLLQRLGDVLLALDLGERPGPVLAVERQRLIATTTSVPGAWDDRNTKGPPAHPPEPAYPCCLPALGEFSGMSAARGVVRPV